MDERKLTEQESLALIGQMIQVAKEEHRERGDGWLIWGWLLLLASVSSAILGFTGYAKSIGWVWTGALVVGLFIYFYTRTRKKQSVEVRTYVQELLDRIGTGFFLSLFAIIAGSYLSKASFAFGYYYILYAFWMFIYGSALRFRPLIIGAMVNWAAAVAIFIIPDFRYDMIVSSVAVIVGYLIPGYMLRSEYRKKLK